MAQKCALIVDDSRTARQTLGRVLEQHAMRVEAAESAESALEHLTHSRPDVIFMDHMMPGMDGFQAVRAIKANPATATIPIMMYTSQEGELYVGQARALGAVGVLPKQIKPVEVSELLQSLHLISSPSGEHAVGTAEVESGHPTPTVESDDGPQAFRAALEPGDWSELHRWLEEMLIHHGQELRTDIESSVRGLLEEQKAVGSQLPDRGSGRPRQQRDRHPTATTLLMLALAGLASVFLWLHLDSQDKWRAAAAQNAGLLAALDSRRNATAAQAAGARELLEAERDMLSGRYQEFLAALEWSVNQAAAYGPEEIPLGDARLEVVDGLVQRLRAIGFGGVVQIDSHVGDFCYLLTPVGRLTPAPGDFPTAACDQVGLPAETAIARSAEQSVAFANYVAALESDVTDPITIEIAAYGNGMPRTAYPPAPEASTAGEWNAAAEQNNRVEIHLLPDPLRQ